MIRRTPFLAIVTALCPLFAGEMLAQSAVGDQQALPITENVELPATGAAMTPAFNVAAEAEASSAGEAAYDVASVFGLSGELRAAMVPSSLPVEHPLAAAAGANIGSARWIPLEETVREGLPGQPVSREGLIAPDGPGVWRLEPDGKTGVQPNDRLAFITTVPFGEKRGAHLNGYHIGLYPTERTGRVDQYAPPEAFIEVTAENQDLQISKHFRLREFLTKDQFDVWPKYLVLNLRLIDKLELVLQELNRMGVRALDLHVMSGFRTPQYNGPGGDGRAALSRHMYGDAADIWVDGDQDGYIDDLNGDGKHDIADAEVLLRAVERVEQRYPELTGGAGLYEANGYHGPFVHVDVRGSRARW